MEQAPGVADVTDLHREQQALQARVHECLGVLEEERGPGLALQQSLGSITEADIEEQVGGWEAGHAAMGYATCKDTLRPPLSRTTR